MFFPNRFTQMPQWHLISFFKTLSPYTFSLIFLPHCILLHDMNNYLIIPSVFVGHWFQEPLQIPKSANAQVFYIKWHSTVSPHMHKQNLRFWRTDLFYCFIFNMGEGNGNPLQYSCLEKSMDIGTWWATVHGVAKSRPRTSTSAYI